MPCLFAVFAGFLPRVALLFLLFFTDIFALTFDGWFIPLIGIIFLPYTTLFYMLAASSMGTISFWGWLTIGMGLVMDLMQWYSTYLKRNNIDQWSSTT